MSTEPAEKTQRPTILVVDDNPENLAVLSAVLRPDYRVRVATEGKKALSIVTSDEPPDLILLDVMMPGISGFEVCERIKDDPSRRDIPVIFVTALGEVEDERKGLDLGAIDYVTKPISPAIVLARVRNHLELARARAALAQQNVILETKVRERTADLLRANDELKESYVETIDLAFATMTEADGFLGNHCKRVATYSYALGERLGLGEESLFDLRVAGLLHDLGLVGVERGELKRLLQLDHPVRQREPLYFGHALVPQRALLTSPRFAGVAAIIAAHHECLDGSGFPGQLAGEAIPLGSRILATADRWDVYAQLDTPTRGEDSGYERFAAQQAGRLAPDVLRALGELLAAGDPFSKVVARPFAELTPGMVVARTIKTTTGAILLSAGTSLRKDHLRDLRLFAGRGEVAGQVHVYRDEGR